MKLNYMRIIALFITLATVSIFTACSSNDKEDDSSTNAAFVGNWTLVGATFTGETAQPSNFTGFSISLSPSGGYSLTNPLFFPTPTGVTGEYLFSDAFIIFDGGTSVHLASITANTMVWEWEVSKPGKITATYRYTFEKN